MTIPDQEARLEDIEQGKIASVAHGYLRIPVEEAMQECMRRMISSYRAQNTQHDVLVGIAAELSALDKLLNDLQVDIRRGETALLKEHGNAQNNQNRR